MMYSVHTSTSGTRTFLLGCCFLWTSTPENLWMMVGLFSFFPAAAGILVVLFAGVVGEALFEPSLTLVEAGTYYVDIDDRSLQT